MIGWCTMPKYKATLEVEIDATDITNAIYALNRDIEDLDQVKFIDIPSIVKEEV